MVGSPPADATERVNNDKMIIPAKIAQEIPRNVLTAMADGLAILADDRTQTVDDLKGVLIPSSAAAAEVKKEAAAGGNKKTAVIVAIIISIIIVALLGWLVVSKVILPALSHNNESGQNASMPTSSVVSLLEDPESVPETLATPDLVGKIYGQYLSETNASTYFKIVIGNLALLLLFK